MDRKQTIIIGGVAAVTVLALLAYGSKQSGDGATHSLATETDASPSIVPLTRMVIPYFRSGRIGGAPTADANSGLPICGCTGKSAYQDQYNDLIAGFNESLLLIQDAYNEAVISTLPTYFTQYLNNYTGALASQNFASNFIGFEGNRF